MRRLLTIVFAALVGVTSIPTGASAGYGGDGRQIAKVKRATAKYHSVEVAIADGYLATDMCVADAAGGMGYHYVKPALLDNTIDPFQPEILVYVPSPSGHRLGAIEYLKPDADQDKTTDGDRPVLFGVGFDGPMDGHEPAMPIHYDLHVWLFKHNPSGLFAPFNPSVSCP